ncbi:MAG: hypothetical protein ABIY70_06630 [Capsulimonas sp.]|uniref:hypothetical protein n=1 Tax=Capsulimonas sp. TaxID=2494211 RepID=UPI003267CAE1
MMNLLKILGDRFLTLLESLPAAMEAILNALVLSYVWFVGSYLFYHYAPQAQSNTEALNPSDLHYPHPWALFGAVICGVPVLLIMLLDFPEHRRPLLTLRHALIWALLYVPLGIAYFRLPW